MSEIIQKQKETNPDIVKDKNDNKNVILFDPTPDFILLGKRWKLTKLYNHGDYIRIEDLSDDGKYLDEIIWVTDSEKDYQYMIEWEKSRKFYNKMIYFIEQSLNYPNWWHYSKIPFYHLKTKENLIYSIYYLPSRIYEFIGKWKRYIFWIFLCSIIGHKLEQAHLPNKFFCSNCGKFGYDKDNFHE